jgi:nucleoside 2-deoxyribosyltransferase
MVGKVFLAAPLFCESERKFNSLVAERFRVSGFEVWLAQEFGLFEHGTLNEKRKVFTQDLLALENCDVVVALLDGVDVDTGVGFELGYAYALKKPLVGLKTDYRTFSKTEEVNLMLEVPLLKLCRSIEEVIEILKKL